MHFIHFMKEILLCQQKHKPSRNKGTIHLLPKNFIKRSFAKVCTHDITRKTNLSQMTQPIDRGLLLFFTMPHPRVFTFLVQAPYILHTFSSVSTQHARQTRCHHWLALSENSNNLRVFHSLQCMLQCSTLVYCVIFIFQTFTVFQKQSWLNNCILWIDVLSKQTYQF